MPLELWSDSAVTTLTSSPSAGATSFTVASSAAFPAAVTATSQFRVVIGTEIVTVTNVSGTTWTVTATAASHASGDAVTHVVTAAALRGLQYPQNALRPAAADYETFPRSEFLNGQLAAAIGTLWLVGIALPAGLTVGKISFTSGTTAASGPTNWWFGLYDSSRVQLAVTANQTATAWAVSTTKTLAIATTAAGSASSFVTTYAGLHYLGFMMTATTANATLAAATATSAMNAQVPILSGTSSAGLTTPPGFPTTAAALTPQAAIAYGWVGP